MPQSGARDRKVVHSPGGRRHVYAVLKVNTNQSTNSNQQPISDDEESLPPSDDDVEYTWPADDFPGLLDKYNILAKKYSTKKKALKDLHAKYMSLQEKYDAAQEQVPRGKLLEDLRATDRFQVGELNRVLRFLRVFLDLILACLDNKPDEWQKQRDVLDSTKKDVFNCRAGGTERQAIYKDYMHFNTKYNLQYKDWMSIVIEHTTKLLPNLFEFDKQKTAQSKRKVKLMKLGSMSMDENWDERDAALDKMFAK